MPASENGAVGTSMFARRFNRLFAHFHVLRPRDTTQGPLPSLVTKHIEVVERPMPVADGVSIANSICDVFFGGLDRVTYCLSSGKSGRDSRSKGAPGTMRVHRRYSL